MTYVFEKLGVTQLTSGSVIVSDPCYELGTWCMGRLDKVAKGRWHVGALKNPQTGLEDSWDSGRYRELILLHEDHAHQFNGVDAGEDTYYADWTVAPFHVGVDSGQAGVYDAAIYGDSDAIMVQDGDLVASSWLKPSERHSAFYAAMCGLTYRNRQMAAGTFSRGAVSSSGYGDGGYDCFYLQVNDEIVGIAIIFIDDRNKDDDDDEYEDEDADIAAPSDELTTLMAGGDPVDLLYRNTLKNLGVENAADKDD